MHWLSVLVLRHYVKCEQFVVREWNGEGEEGGGAGGAGGLEGIKMYMFYIINKFHDG